MLKAIVFDIGGVLAYNIYEYLLLDKKNGVLSICNLDEDEVLQVGNDLWNEFAYLPAKSIDDSEKLEKKYWKKFIKKLKLSQPAEAFINMTDNYIRDVKGMFFLLEKLHSKGIKMAICSNNTEFWYQRQKDKFDLQRFFDPNKIILSCRIGVSKSSPNFEMFNAVTDALGINKASCVLIDDRDHNIEMALKFGMTAILFPKHAEYGAQYLDTLLMNMGL